MKSKFFLLFLLFYNSYLCTSQIKNDLVKENIIGAVKSIVEEEYVNNDGNISTGIPFKKISNYNTKGYLTSVEYYEDTIKGKDIFKYDAIGNKTECQVYNYYFKTVEKCIYLFDKDKNQLHEKCYLENGNLYRTVLYNYNGKGNIISRIIINSDGTTRGQFLYKYDDKRNKMEEDQYSGSEVLSKYYHIYDSIGNEIKLITSGADDKIIFRTTFKYENYDDLGNWIIKTRFTDNKQASKTTRVIKYWDIRKPLHN